MIRQPQTLLDRIRLGEDTTIECKALRFRGDRVAGPSRSDLADEIAAMANTADGLLVLGVEDGTRKVAGIPMDLLDTAERFVFEVCSDSIRPEVSFRTQRVELPDSGGVMRPVLVVEIPRSLFVHESPGGYFHRQGSSKRRMPPDLLARLFQQRSQARLIRFEEQIVPRAQLADLDADLYRRYITGGLDSTELALTKLGLAVEGDDGAIRPTVAGLLLCSRSPERFLPSAIIASARYRGTSQAAAFVLDAQDIAGPLDAQVRDALAFGVRNMAVRSIKTPGRAEYPEYSIRALFEAIVNAVAHRDYSVHGSKIRLLMYDDRLEIYSPGPFPNTITAENVAYRQSTRNELITSLLARTAVHDPHGRIGRQYMMEKRGDGVPIILAESERLGARAPVYRVLDDAEVVLTIYAAPAPDPDSV